MIPLGMTQNLIDLDYDRLALMEREVRDKHEIPQVFLNFVYPTTEGIVCLHARFHFNTKPQCSTL
jgi:hypothetical protein